MSPKQIMLIAGEPSGDQLAAELVTALKAEFASTPHSALPAPRLFGAGGPKMAAAGFELGLDLTQHSVIGLWEVVRNYGKFRRLFNQLLRVACERQPDIIVCVDFQGFNSRFASAVRERTRGVSGGWQPRIVQYVSPQVWASRPGRAQTLARNVDLLLSIIPFEKQWYAERAPQLRVEFVGHPIVDRHPNAACGVRSAESSEASASPCFILHPPSSPEVLLLPGSRVGELKRHLPPMLEAARITQREQVGVRFRMVLPDEQIKRLVGGATALQVSVQVGGLADALRSATVAIASTGTVTLECAWFGVPTVALYRTSWPTYLIGRQVVTVDHLAMPNLLAGETVFPELIQHGATGANIAREALALLNDPQRRAAVKARLAKVAGLLGPPGASARAAKAIVSLLR